MRAMLSQPMAGKTEEEIREARERAISVLEAKGYEIVNTLFTDEWYSQESMKERGVVQIPLCFLAKSLENMSLCHAAFFCKGWEGDLIIFTLEGQLLASPGDYIIRGVKGELYPCKPDIFDATYEKVDE